jgi:precorrin-6A/cobalt-precorrin-6A reductase
MMNSVTDMRRRVLILGGTLEARLLAEQLATRTDIEATLSLAGRTASPRAQAVPVRRGGFGGIEGLIQYLREHRIDVLLDATHPYAATMSAHASSAAAQTHTPLIALHRAAWEPAAGDRWTEVADVEQAVQVLGQIPRRVLLALGRQEIGAVVSAPQHHYLIRSVDPVDPPLTLPHAQYLVARGPFAEEAEFALLREHAIEVVIAKNSGGAASYTKIAAARALGVAVVLLRPPVQIERAPVSSVAEAMARLDHVLTERMDRGV